MPGGRHITLPGEGAGLGFHAQVFHLARVTSNTIAALSIHRTVLVEVVGIVIADLGGFMGQGIELGARWIVELQVLLQAQAQQPREVAVTFSATEVILGYAGGENFLTGTFQAFTEFFPQLATAQCFEFGRRHNQPPRGQPSDLLSERRSVQFFAPERITLKGDPSTSTGWRETAVTSTPPTARASAAAAAPAPPAWAGQNVHPALP